MGSTGRLALIFLLRAGGIVLIASAIGVLLTRETWGSPGILAISWGALWALVLGLIGFRSLGRAMACEPTKMMGVMATGLIQRVIILAASQAGVFLLYGGEWGRRTLSATVILYMLVLGVEVFTLNQALRAGTWQRTAREAVPTDADEASRGVEKDSAAE